MEKILLFSIYFLAIFIGSGLIFLWDIVTSPTGYFVIYVLILIINVFGYMLVKDKVDKRKNMQISALAFIIAIVPIVLLYHYWKKTPKIGVFLLFSVIMRIKGFPRPTFAPSLRSTAYYCLVEIIIVIENYAIIQV